MINLLTLKISYLVRITGVLVNSPPGSVLVKSQARSNLLKTTSAPTRSPAVVVRRPTNSPAFKRTLRPTFRPTKSPVPRTGRKPTPAPSRLKQAPTKSSNPLVLPTVPRTRSPSSVAPTKSIYDGISISIFPVSVTKAPSSAPPTKPNYDGIQISIFPVSVTKSPSSAPPTKPIVDGIISIFPVKFPTNAPTQQKPVNPASFHSHIQIPKVSSNQTIFRPGPVITPILDETFNGTATSAVNQVPFTPPTAANQSTILPVPRAVPVQNFTTNSTAESSTAAILPPSTSPSAVPTVVVPIETDGPYRWYFLPTASPTRKPSEKEADAPSNTTQPIVLIPTSIPTNPKASSNQTFSRPAPVITPIFNKIVNGTAAIQVPFTPPTAANQSTILTNTDHQSSLPVPRAVPVQNFTTNSTAESSTAAILPPSTSPSAVPTVVVPIETDGPYRWYFLPTALPTRKPSEKEADVPSSQPSNVATADPEP